MSFGFGISAALASPLVMTIGFLFWQNHWQGSAFALNLYKCTLASAAFFVTVVISWHQEQSGARLFPVETFTRTTVGYLCLSSTIGIIIGDVLWLQALQYLGARRVIFVDSLKPFVAAFLGFLVLGERIRLAALGGIVLTVLGILVVSLTSPEHEAESKARPTISATSPIVDNDNVEPVKSTSTPLPNETVSSEDSLSAPIASPATESTPARDNQTRSVLWTGYTMSLANVVLDTYGAVLIKEYGLGMTVWEINLLRFGFASVVMIVISLGMMLYHVMARCGIQTSATMVATRDSGHPPTSDSTCPWYALPLTSPMTVSAWLHVSVGVALVTFLAASLSNYALFNIALALTLTLTSIGPLYALPLTYLLSSSSNSNSGSEHDRQPVTLQAVGGALLAVGGIAVLAFWGTLPEEDTR